MIPAFFCETSEKASGVLFPLRIGLSGSANGHNTPYYFLGNASCQLHDKHGMLVSPK